MPSKSLSLVLFLSLAASLFAVDFRFLQEEGMRYRIVAEVEEGVWADSQLLGQSEILNRIGVTVKNTDSEGALLDVEYGISEKSLDTGLYIYSRDESTSFYRSHRGLYGQIPLDEYLPSVRNIPTFPDKPVEEGASWSAAAEEVHDLLPFFAVDYRLHIPFRVYYTYMGKGHYEGREVDLIRISYHFLQNIDVLSLPPGVVGPEAVDLPVAVAGDFKQDYYWDPNAGIPAAVEDEFKISYAMASGVNYIFRGRSVGRVIEADQWDREDVKESIEEAVEEMEDVSVSLSDEGIVLTLENVHFHPDSSRFLPGEEEKLLRLKDLLLSFPEHDLLITGHTARVRGGSADQGQGLSEDRAAAVASFFLAEGVRDQAAMIVQGKGSREPVGDNSTEEGKRKNRRVEITILDN